MTDDIVTRLRGAYKDADEVASVFLTKEAADEIELLRRAFDLSIGELSTNDKYQYLSPEQLRNQFLEEALRG